MLSDSLSLILSSLDGSCGLLKSRQKYMLETIETCLGVIRSIAMMIGVIFQRARFILDTIADNSSQDRHVEMISKAIMSIGDQTMFLCVTQSLTNALKSIADRAKDMPLEISSKMKRCLKRSVRACLVSMKSVLGFAHSITKTEIYADSPRSYHQSQECFFYEFLVSLFH